MTGNIQIEQVNSIALAVVRRRTTLRELSIVIPEACGTVWKVIQSQQIKGAGRHIALYWDEEINLEVGVELKAPLAVEGALIRSATPAGTVATATLLGPYHQLPKTHEAIRKWCTTKGHALAGPCWEIYGHWDTEWNADSSRIRTDVYHLLA